ncbi:hypothetical protein [Phaeobacter sp.]|uniref:hypothetical protein n=1 Tax=Phaeobacter sp. TaxID=1902409 RepID=UPI0025FF570D|nr:hypothetical protein [Phaeobacter sp.]
MKPGFALILSSQAVSLRQRVEDGWISVGETALDVADLSAALSELRQQGEARAGGPVACKLVIPDDQIRYLMVDAPANTNDDLHVAQQALDGATPYEVTELAFDVTRQDGSLYIAAVARETLQEAEEFAVGNGFLPVSFMATPSSSAYIGEPDFGPSQTLIAAGEATPEPDDMPLSQRGTEPEHKTETSGEAASTPEADTAPKETAAKGAEKTAANGKAAPKPDVQASGEAPTQATATTADGTDTSKAGASAEKSVALAEPNDIDSAAPSAGFATRRRKSAPSATRERPDGSSAPPIAATPTSASDSKAKQPAASDSPKGDPKGNADKGPRVVPHAAFGTIALADSAVADAEQSDQSRAAPSAPRAANPTTPKQGRFGLLGKSETTAEAPAPVLSRSDEPTEEPGPQTTDRKALHEAGKAKLLAGVSEQHVGGKPRFLGLMLMLGLLALMALAAVWAAVSEQDKDPAAQSEQTTDPQTALAVEPDAGAEPEVELAPQVSAIPSLLDGDTLPAEPTSDIDATEDDEVDGATTTGEETVALTPSDAAVLDALSTAPAPTVLDNAEAEADAAIAEALETAPTDELTQAAQYAATGIWQNAPSALDVPGGSSLEDLYIASIDSTDISEDAIALPQPDRFAADLGLDIVANPTAAGQAFDLDERGLVTATPEGTLTPDGIVVYLGAPEVVPPPTPERPDLAALAAEAETARLAELAALRPKTRPDDLAEQNERARLGGLSRAELATLRPKLRPASLKPAEENSLPVTEQAVAISVMPRIRPNNFANIVDRAQRNSTRTAAADAAQSVAAAASAPAAPRIPSSASVARQATLDNAINLRRVNLIGVYGTPSNRRALVLMPNGRYKKVKVGDRMDGGRVIAIGDSQLQYQKGSRNLTLTIPSG